MSPAISQVTEDAMYIKRIENKTLRDGIHSSVLAWKIPWAEEPGMLQSMGSQRVRHDSVTKPHNNSYFPRDLHIKRIENKTFGDRTQSKS